MASKKRSADSAELSNNKAQAVGQETARPETKDEGMGEFEDAWEDEIEDEVVDEDMIPEGDEDEDVDGGLSSPR